MAFKFETLLKQPKAKTPEFKSYLSSLKLVIKNLVEIAIITGGLLVIGVTDDPLRESPQDLINSLLNGN